MKSSPNLFKRITIPCIPDYSLLGDTYVKNQLIVTFENFPKPEDIKTVQGYFHEMGFDNVKIKKCKNCDLYVQLWEAENIESVVVTKGVTSGSGSDGRTVGESYSLNFLNKIPPLDYKHSKTNSCDIYKTEKYNKEIVKIAVLDTGLDRTIVDENYISTDNQNEPGFECFGDKKDGWNFIENSDNINDDNPGRHGSLVTQFIINQFKNITTKTVRIIPVKTHDSTGRGNLFDTFCAIHYAIARGAKIINASWGFYYYGKGSVQILDILIEKLRTQGILFVTASGNQIDEDDDKAKKILAAQGIIVTPFQLRNLAIHRFLPACLSNPAKNVVTVTTFLKDQVASTENHSNVFVDMGVKADKYQDGDQYFKVPFAQIGEDEYVRGSSFATAIATGIIGANCSLELYTKFTINKQSFIQELINLPGSTVCSREPAMANELIRDGVCIERIKQV